MKIAVWLYFLAVLLTALSCAFGVAVMHDFYHVFLKGARLPNVSEFLQAEAGWFLVLPFPWLVWAICLSRRRELAASSYAIYTSSCILAMVMLVGVSLFGSLLPLIIVRSNF
jgi:hypothetical protein